jgi:vancomycin resistance protein VanJ
LEAVLSGGLHRVPVLRAHFARRWKQSRTTSDWVSQTPDPVLLTGDLNQPSDSAIFRRFWSRCPDAFSSSGLGFGHTKLTRWYGIRIDHILAGPGWRFRRCWIGPDIGSDHLPVIADVEPLDVRH